MRKRIKHARGVRSFEEETSGWEGRPENGATFQEVERVNEQAVRSTVSTSQGDVRRRLQRCWKVAFHDELS